MSNQRHYYHLVHASPWPILGGLSVFVLCNGGILYFNSIKFGGYVLLIGLSLIIFVMANWWKDIIREATFEGRHTIVVQRGLRFGMILFIISEIMFFFAFFWAYFHASIAPSIEIGSVWPPHAIVAFSPWEVPLINTLILLLSGVTVTWSHHAILNNLRGEAIFSLILTILLAISFTVLQGYEYIEAPFNITDGVYGSTFFMATGFHGLHVIIGTLFLSVMLYRLYRNHFTNTHHFGFEAAAWYWHFVDVVWLFLYISIYTWGYYA